jgi:hypothetical protein
MFPSARPTHSFAPFIGFHRFSTLAFLALLKKPACRPVACARTTHGWLHKEVAALIEASHCPAATAQAATRRAPGWEVRQLAASFCCSHA